MRIKLTSVAATVATGLALVVVPPRAEPVPAAATTISIGVIGDSITTPCATPGGGYCGKLQALLAANGVVAVFHVAAVSGASCGGLIGPAKTMLTQRPQLVIIACGTNNDTSTTSARDALGAQWRTLVEASHVAGAKVLPTFIQYSNPEIQRAQGRAWLIDSQPRVNDVIYSNLHYYQPYGWFAGLLDLQQIPGNWDYLAGGADGIHPNAFGEQVEAMLIYRALRGHYGWPDTVPQPCGMWGHRPDLSYLRYITYTPCAGVT
jgi:lysophospholipase L1-like esterase